MQSNPFFTNRVITTNDSMTLEENGVLKNDSKETEVFNNCYISTVETTSRKRPSSIGNPNFQCQGRATVKKIIESYKNHPIVATI